MKRYLVWLLLLLPIFGSGQITLTNENVPEISDVFVIGVDNSVSTLLKGSAGANQVWDFRNFTPDLIENFTILDPASVASSALFPEATIVYNSGLGNFIFSQVTEDAIFSLGSFLGSQVIQDTIISKFDPPRKNLIFPITYQDTFTSQSKSELGFNEIDQTNSLLLVQVESIYNEVDAYGTLRLSSGDYQVLRLIQINNRQDSTFLVSNGIRTFFGATNTTDTTYQWLAKEAKGALVTLTIIDNAGSNTASLSILDLENSQLDGENNQTKTPVASFRFLDGGGGQFFFFDQSTNAPTSWKWDFGDGDTSIIQDPMHQFLSEGTFTVCLTASNAKGSDTSCLNIGISGLKPLSSFTAELIDRQTYSFENNSSGEENQYIWDFGDGNSSTEVAPVHIYQDTGRFVVSLIASNAFGQDTSFLNLQVIEGAPEANFGLDSIGIGLFSFENLSIGTANQYLWDFGDGNTSTLANPNHQYTQEGDFTVCLTARNDFGVDSTCTTLEVRNLFPVAQFSSQDEGNGVYLFTNTSKGENNQYIWDFGDGTNSNELSPQHQFPGDGNFQVCLIATNNFGSDTTCTTINLSGLNPVADFIFQNLEDGLIAFTDQSSVGDNTYLWDFGDGNTSTDQDPTYQYSSEGQFTVCLIVTNQFASDSICKTITLTGLIPLANFEIIQEDLADFWFNNLSSGSNNQYEWDFGDGTTSTDVSPLYSYRSEGTFQVRLIASNIFGKDTSQQNITLENLLPVANFGAEIGLGGAVTFSDSTLNMPDSWAWDFGDGNTADEQNPSHTYMESGLFMVTLISSNRFGRDTSTQELNVIISSLEFLYPGSRLEISPNPFRNQVQLDLTGAAVGKDFKLEVFDNKGSLISSDHLNSTQRLDATSWVKGVYLLRLFSVEHQQVVGTYRLVKQ